MRVVVRVDAVPGFENAVEANLRRVKGVTAVARQKVGNFDLVALVEVADAAVFERLMSNELRTISGVRGLEHIEEPGADVLRMFGHG